MTRKDSIEMEKRMAHQMENVLEVLNEGSLSQATNIGFYLRTRGLWK